LQIIETELLHTSTTNSLALEMAAKSMYLKGKVKDQLNNILEEPSKNHLIVKIYKKKISILLGLQTLQSKK
jgi:hypothetical protein